MSLNKIETVIKLLPLVDNCCLVAQPSKSYCVCLITPNLKKSQEFIKTYANDSNGELSGNVRSTSSDQNQEAINEFVRILDSDVRAQQSFNKELLEHCLKQGLERFEIPIKTKFVREIWLPDSGLVTDSLKLKRREIEKFYENEIKSIYT